MDPSFFVWLDETGCDRRDSLRQKAHDTLFAWITSHQCQAQSCIKAFSAIAAMSNNGIEDVIIYEETADGEVVLSYIEQTIIPTLQPFNGSNPQSILIMDTASINHLEEVVRTITVTPDCHSYIHHAGYNL